MKIREMNIRNFKDLLKEYGYTFLKKCKGSHEEWQNNTGNKFVFPSNSKVISSGIVWQFVRCSNINKM